jgi:hypothetical protein
MTIFGNSIPAWIQIVAYAYLSIGFASALYIIWDIMRRHHHQEMPVMNIVWPITAWYLGPLALWAYWHIGHLKIGSHSRVDRSEISVETESVPHHIIGTHKSKVEDKSKEVKPFWETIFVSATHCGAR